MQIQIDNMVLSLVGLELPTIIIYVVLLMISETIYHIGKVPKGQFFDFSLGFKNRVHLIGFIFGLVGALSMIWFSFEPSSFFRSFYSIIQILSATIVGNALALGLSWIFKGDKHAMMNLSRSNWDTDLKNTPWR